MTRFFAWDNCRCLGDDCPKKGDCLRHLSLDDMGPRTPMANRLCRIERNEYDQYIPTEPENNDPR